MSKHPPRCRCGFCQSERAWRAMGKRPDRPGNRPAPGTRIEAKWTEASSYEDATVSPFFLDRFRIAVDFSDGRSRGYLLSDQGKSWRLTKAS